MLLGRSVEDGEHGPGGGIPATAGFYTGGPLMSPSLAYRWATWSKVSSGFREIELRGDRLESVGHFPHVLPQRMRWYTWVY